MSKRITFVSIIVAVSIIFAGCSYSQTGIDTLLSPPRLSDQQNQIYNALEAVVGSNIKLKYPQQGDFTSAFIINNLDSEPTQEAIVFYENTATSSLRMNVLDQQEDRWVSAYEIGIDASGIDKVSFITSNKRIYIIVGYNLISKNEKNVSLYEFDDGILNEISSIICSDYEVFDMIGDQTAEIISFVPSKGDRELKTVTAMLYRITPTGMGVIAQAPMDPEVSSYMSLHKGRLEDGSPALYIDGLKGTNALCTEILVANDMGRLQNLMYLPEGKDNLITQTRRGYGSLSIDLNGDRIYEIPNLRASSGYEKMAPPQKQYFTEWYNYSEGELVLQKTTYAAYSLGYVFTIPTKWLDNLKVDFVTGDSELVFYDHSLNDAHNAKLFSIKVFKRPDYEKDAKINGYTLLNDNGQLIYTYKIYESGSELKIFTTDLYNGFALL